MECGGAAYARVPGGGVLGLEEALKAARANHAAIGLLGFDPATHSFALIDRWGKSDDMPRWAEGPDLSRALGLATLSKAVGEVVAFYEIEDGGDLGVYGVWKDGVLTRSLVWVMGKWLTVEGAAEPWEAAFVQRVKDEDPDQAGAPDRLEAGASGPRPGGVSLGAMVYRHLGAVGWGVPQPWPRRRDAMR